MEACENPHPLAQAKGVLGLPFWGGACFSDPGLLHFSLRLHSRSGGTTFLLFNSFSRSELSHAGARRRWGEFGGGRNLDDITALKRAGIKEPEKALGHLRTKLKTAHSPQGAALPLVTWGGLKAQGLWFARRQTVSSASHCPTPRRIPLSLAFVRSSPLSHPAPPHCLPSTPWSTSLINGAHTKCQLLLATCVAPGACPAQLLCKYLLCEWVSELGNHGQVDPDRLLC